MTGALGRRSNRCRDWAAERLQHDQRVAHGSPKNNSCDETCRSRSRARLEQPCLAQRGIVVVGGVVVGGRGGRGRAGRRVVVVDVEVLLVDVDDVDDVVVPYRRRCRRRRHRAVEQQEQQTRSPARRASRDVEGTRLRSGARSQRAAAPSVGVRRSAPDPAPGRTAASLGSSAPNTDVAATTPVTGRGAARRRRHGAPSESAPRSPRVGGRGQGGGTDRDSSVRVVPHVGVAVRCPHRR